MENLTIRKATFADVDKLVVSMANAFDNDPFINWLVRKDKHRKKGIEELFRAALNVLTLPFNEVVAVDNCAGAALWMPMENVKTTVSQQLRLLFPIIRIAGFSGLKRVVTCLDILEKAHPMDKKHLYFFFLGVDPSHQKKGLASAMIKTMLDRCDRDGLGAYLENTNPANRPLYESFGFKAIRELSVGPGSPILLAMYREPQG
jgi:ribosomal protein S18 acetylase RimI-like enzyme